MKNEILKAFYTALLQIANHFMEQWQGHKDERTIELVISGFLKFIHDELEIQ